MTDKTIVNPEQTQRVQQATFRVQASAMADDQTIRTNRIANDDEEKTGDFILKGKCYQNIKCLSDHSGEAQVFLVKDGEGEKVLKLYYPNFSINKTLMRIIQNFDMEMVVKVQDYGKTYVDGKNRDYELMEYLRGGNLGEYDLDGNFNQFRRIALQAAAALEYCHNSNIIHKDIKPSNFFFRDENHTQLVLGDFGISSVIRDDEDMHKTTQARTPAYAAPEMYNDVIDGEVEITPSVDSYSLGIALMTLWLGESPFSQNERVMMRKKNEGRLPRINELPERVKMIVLGLTAVNPKSRWDYNHVERWFLGENVPVDISSPLLKYRSFVVDPERNLVADNVHELIPLLVDNEKLAINYLYNGHITSWLEQCGNVKLSATLKDIVSNRYPVDQTAGLMSAIYAMEPTYPYRDLRGKLCDNLHSVVISVLAASDEYALALKNEHDSLFLYLESHSTANIERLRSYFREDSHLDSRKAILQLAYEVDSEIPFLPKYPSSNISEIVRAYGYEDCTDDEWMALSDGRLLSWMYAHEDRMACESLRIMTEGQQPSKALGYKVLYNIDRNAAFDLREAQTPDAVGACLLALLHDTQHSNDEDFAAAIADYSDPDGRFHYFAQLHGWMEQINMARSCFDMSSDENTERLGVYDLRTAAYRFCMMLGVCPTYMLEDGIELHDVKAMQQYGKRTVLIGELQRGALKQWMSIFYHENPKEDFRESYSYERSLEQWILALGEIDQTQTYYKRYCEAKTQTAQKFERVHGDYIRANMKERMLRMVFYALCVLWVLMLAVCGISGREYLLEHAGLTIVLPVGGIMALIIAMRAYFHGFGFVLSALWGSLGLFSTYIPVAILRHTQKTAPAMFVPVVIVITAVYMAICYFTDYRKERRNDGNLIDEVMDDDIKTSLLEPLYFTFRQKSYRFKGSKFGLLDDVSNQIRSISGESVAHYLLWSVMVLIMVMELLVYSPKLLNVKNPDLDNWRLNPTKVVNQLQRDVE